jgi:sugar phosphate isomerase/epimerase
MIRSPLGFRINPSPEETVRDQIRDAARAGAKGVVLDAAGELAPDRLSETGRREVRYLLRSVELGLIALSLPTRRAFDTEDQLDDRLARSDRAFALAYELGALLVLARVGGIPPEAEPARSEVFIRAVRELGRRADHRGVRLAIETGADPGEALGQFLREQDHPGLAASLDPGTLLRSGHDPVAAAVALGPWVAHAYANDASSLAGGSRIVPNPRGFGFPAGVLDWEEYLGALEEIGYRGYLTVWPDPSSDQGAQFRAMAERLKRF